MTAWFKSLYHRILGKIQSPELYTMLKDLTDNDPWN